MNVQHQMLKEFGDKIPADDRAKIEAAAAKLKTAHDNKDIATIDVATAELQSAWNEASQKMYAAQGGAQQQPGADFNGGFNQQAGPQGPQGGNHGGNDQEVQDVDFEEVK